MDNWINVEDRLPEEGQEIDIWLEKLKMREPDVKYENGLFIQEGKTFKNIGTQYIFVSHWQPLPEPPTQ